MENRLNICPRIPPLRPQDVADAETVYSLESGGPDGDVEVSKVRKLLESVRNNPIDIRFDDACMIAMFLGFEKKGGNVHHGRPLYC